MTCDPCNKAAVMLALVAIKQLVEACRKVPKSEVILHAFEQIATQRKFVGEKNVDDKKTIDGLMGCELDLIEIWLDSCEAKMNGGEDRKTTLRRLMISGELGEAVGFIQSHIDNVSEAVMDRYDNLATRYNEVANKFNSAKSG